MNLLCVVLLYRFHKMHACRKNLDCTSLFSLNDYKNNKKVIYKYFKDKYSRRSKS